jgi:hypothetical protein
MSKYPKVSVITPTYNRMRFLPECIDSVLAQNWPNFEYIISDDGSTDGTREYIKFLNKSLKNKIKYFWRKNQGATSAINFAIKKSKGEFICIMDSDDIMLPESIRSRAEFLVRNREANYVYGKRYILESRNEYKWILTENKKYTGFHPKFVRLKTQKDQLNYALTHIAAPPHCTVMSRKKALIKIGLYDEKLKTAYATELYFRIMTKDKFYFIDKYIYALRRDSRIKRVSLPINEFKKFLDKNIFPKFIKYINKK